MECSSLREGVEWQRHWVAEWLCPRADSFHQEHAVPYQECLVTYVWLDTLVGLREATMQYTQPQDLDERGCGADSSHNQFYQLIKIRIPLFLTSGTHLLFR